MAQRKQQPRTQSPSTIPVISSASLTVEDDGGHQSLAPVQQPVAFNVDQQDSFVNVLPPRKQKSARSTSQFAQSRAHVWLQGTQLKLLAAVAAAVRSKSIANSFMVAPSRGSCFFFFLTCLTCLT